MAQIAANNGYEVVVGTWDREPAGGAPTNQRGITFTIMRLRSFYGVRSLPFIPIWVTFALFRALFGGFSVIQASNLDGLVPALLASAISRSKVIYDLADVYADTYALNSIMLRRLSRSVEPSLLRRADALVLASEGQLSQIRGFNLPKTRMVFYNIPMNQPGVPGSSPNKPEASGKITLFFGGVMLLERYDALRNVMKAIRGLPVRVLLAGFGEHTKLFEQLHKMGDAEFLGKLTHAEIQEYTRRADAILLPYFSDYPNHSVALANKFFDAMEAGTIVLAPRHTLMGEITEKEGIGLLTDYRNVQEIRSSVETLVEMGESDRRFMSVKGKTLFRTRFNTESMEKEYVSILDLVQRRQVSHD